MNWSQVLWFVCHLDQNLAIEAQRNSGMTQAKKPHGQEGWFTPAR